MRVTFDSMVFGGEALARHDGKAIFVPFAMPGDEAEITIVADRGRFARARITRLITPASARIAPRCKHFGVCGGCQWQHVPYDLQLQYKTQIVREQLTRIGGLSEPLVHPTIGADEPWHYRNHIQFHVADDGRLGFMAAKTNTVVPIDECHILAAPVETLWRELELTLPDLVEVALRAGIHTGERLAALRLASDEAPEAEIDLPVNCVVQLRDGSAVVLSGDDHFHERLNEQTFQVSAESFFQVNTPQAEKLVGWLVSWLAINYQPTNQPNILDAYCGVGTFALALAPHAQRVVGIESAPSAVRDARVNTQAFANVEIVEGAVETVLPRLSDSFDVMVLDPPREGCAPAVLDAIAARRIPRMVYVSCDPSTLARDVKRLAAKGYRFVEAQPLDMFPQTYHIETVATLALS
ncbi:MAG: 23S rRNA (uracil(1939)-C(5))-methyltransferase RlmD [Chloroflexota bacterium]